MAAHDGYPRPASAAVVAVMKGNRSRDTSPEVALRSLVHQLGLRFRKDYLIRLDGFRVRADLAFPRRRIAVFVDGCFWHGCPEHGHQPRRNEHYWIPKLERNARRDGLVVERLTEAGWDVLRIWEHVPPEEAAAAVAAAVERAA
jgi:DNA mismatch endonuclease (patch repair protein)